MKYEVYKTDIFDKWLKNLKDRNAKPRIDARLERIEDGNFGFHKRLSANLYEMKFTFGKGYRVYYTFRGKKIVLLLAGGTKQSQHKDIKAAEKMIDELG